MVEESTETFIDAALLKEENDEDDEDEYDDWMSSTPPFSTGVEPEAPACRRLAAAGSEAARGGGSVRPASPSAGGVAPGCGFRPLSGRKSLVFETFPRCCHIRDLPGA